jgi:hypothetical protein
VHLAAKGLEPVTPLSREQWTSCIPTQAGYGDPVAALCSCYVAGKEPDAEPT